jgi:hypothetical protein
LIVAGLQFAAGEIGYAEEAYRAMSDDDAIARWRLEQLLKMSGNIDGAITPPSSARWPVARLDPGGAPLTASRIANG